jgi:hypothetical protein
LCLVREWRFAAMAGLARATSRSAGKTGLLRR